MVKFIIRLLEGINSLVVAIKTINKKVEKENLNNEIVKKDDDFTRDQLTRILR